MLKQTAILLFSMVMMVSYSQSTPKQPVSDNTEVATFAGGCFWCTESDFEKVPGVIKAISGYIGGDVENPTYQDVSNGITGHAEAVEVYFNPDQVSYRQLLDVYWKTINPTDMGGQFVDRGSQYRPVIFYHNQDQKLAAEQSRLALEESAHFDKPIVTGIQKASRFWPAEEYHQDYHQKNPIRYKYYRYSSGRDQFLDATWGKNALKAEVKKIMNQSDSHTVSKQVLYQKPSDEELRERLSPLQFQVTQRDATERPFDNAYWDEKREGIYVDIASGEPLFSSKDKFKSGTGWPSFTQPLYSENIVEKSDFSLFSRRTEVRSKNGDSHLGHLFEDGPKPTGLRYCINSASLRFIPKDLLNQEGYEDLTALF